MSSAGIRRWWGPVFEAERVTRARRWQGYAVRVVFVLGLLLSLVLVYRSWDVASISVQEMAEMGESAYSTLVSLQLLGALLIAPAATAGAVCLDKSRGMLAHVFVTDLSNREIILGKLAARLVPVWSLLACALPVAAMATWLGGIDPVALTGAFFIAAGVAALGCSLALMLSVWASKPQEVIAAVFGIWTLWLLACPTCELLSSVPRPPRWLEWTNPFYLATDPYTYPGETTLLDAVLFALGCGVLGAGCVGLAVAQVRAVGGRSDRGGARRVGPIGRCLAAVRGQIRWGKGPELDANPVRWREWHRNRPSRWSRIVWGGFYLLSAVASVGLIIGLVVDPVKFWDEELVGIAAGFLATLGLLLVSTGAASVLADERAQGSLDVLLSTPIATRTILWAKWRGAFRSVPYLAVWPVILGVGYSIVGEPNSAQVAIVYLIPVVIVAQGAALVSLGLALATWIKRTGPATAWTVGVYVAAVVGWPILGSFIPLVRRTEMGIGPGGTLVILYRAEQTVGTVALDWLIWMGSPFVSAGDSMASVIIGPINRGGNMNPLSFVILLVTWTALYGLLALILFEATVRTFDRCLGRSPEQPRRPPLKPTGQARSVRAWIGSKPRRAGRALGSAASLATSE